MITRREALKQLLGGLAFAALPSGLFVPETPAALLAPEEPLLQEPEPVRRYWQVGANLRSGGSIMGWVPVDGQPGLFLDRATGEILNIRDFRATDKFDTIVVAPEGDWRHTAVVLSYALAK